MNNMLEYMTGGQCYKCGGKVRYADGGENMQEQQPMQQGSPVANMGMQQPQRQPSTIDANAKELMRFLLAQLQKGTSERILKKTLTDSGLKAEQADELLGIAKQEFDRTLEEGEYSTSAEEEQMQIAARQQQMAQQQMMGQAGPGAGMDPSMMAMNQQTDQSQTADSEMEARFGGSMRRLRRMNMGGTCADGLMWDDVSGRCVPTSTTANVMSAGAGPVNMGASNPVGTQQQVMQQAAIDNQNTVAQAQSQDRQRNAQMGYYDKIINNANTKRETQFGNRMTAMAGLHDMMLQGQLPWQKQSVPIGTNTQQNQEGSTMAQFGGLTRFVNGGLKKYGPGGTEDGCPEGYYKDNNGDCQKIFGSGQAKQEYQKQVVDFWNQNPSQDPNSNKAPMMSFEEWQQTGEGKAQDQMYNDMITSPKAFQKYVNDYSTANAGKAGAQPHMAYDDWKAQQLGQQNTNNANVNNNNNTSAPIDPRVTNSPYIVRTDKNKIANLDNNWVNRGLAIGSNIGSAQSLGYAGAFGPYLQAIMGLTGAASSAALGVKKLFAGDKRTVYDDKGNVFVYGNKRSFRRAGRDDSSNQNNQQDNTDQQDNKDPYSDLTWGQRRAIKRGENAIARNDRRLQKRLAEDPNYLDTPEGEIVAYEDGNVFDRSRDAGNYEGGQNPDMYKQSYWDTKKKDYQDLDDAAYTEKYGSSKADDSDQSGTGPLIPPDYDKLGKTVRDAEGNWYIDRNPNDPSQGRYMIPDKKRPSEAGYDRWKSDDPDNPASGSWWNNQKESAMTIPSQQEGGEWNPFVDNRRKLRISMPMYNGGGPIKGEMFPLQQFEWAQATGKPMPLSQQDVDAYNNYVKNFNNNTAQTNMTNNANNALSNNPNANMVNTKKYTIGYGDDAGSRLAQNWYSGLAGANAAISEIQGNKRIEDIQKVRQGLGNSMEIAAVNPQGDRGTTLVNAGPGANQLVTELGARQSDRETINKYGGSIYRRGGTYMVSPQELQAIIAMGGEVEFLD